MYCLCNENKGADQLCKGADQLCGYCAADLAAAPLFSHMQKSGFLITWLI